MPPPFINIWNPLCKKYQWVRVINRFKVLGKTIKSHLDVNNNKDYEIQDNYYVVNAGENNFCECNKFLVCKEEQIFRVAYYHKFNKWVDKIKIYPEPNLGEKNVYTNKYSGVNSLENYNKLKQMYPRYVTFKAPIECCKK